MTVLIGVDPSINDCGIAVVMFSTQSAVPILALTRNLDLRPIPILADKASEICRLLKVYKERYKVRHIISEFPTFQNSTRGNIAAQKGYTLNLAYLVGFIEGQFPTDSIHYTPSQWKGSQNKEMVGKKFQRLFNIDYQNLTDHEFEAAMVTVYHYNKTK